MASSSEINSTDSIAHNLQNLTEQVAKLSGQICDLKGIYEEVKLLKKEIKEKDEVISVLSKRVDDLEQYSKRQNIVINGLNVEHKSYARSVQCDQVNDDEHAPDDEKLKLETRVLNFLNENVTNVDSSEIEACHTIPSKFKGPKPIVVRFVNRKSKTRIMKNLKAVIENNKKPTTKEKIYINDHLTKKNSELAACARKLRQQKKVEGTFVRNCVVHIKLRGESPETSRLVQVKDFTDFEMHGLMIEEIRNTRIAARNTRQYQG